MAVSGALRKAGHLPASHAVSQPGVRHALSAGIDGCRWPGWGTRFA